MSAPSPRDLVVHQLLLDPSFWRPRLEAMEAVPRHLALLPRPDLSRPGIEVLELRLRSWDNQPLRALLGRPAFRQEGDCVRMRPSSSEAEEPDYLAIEEGQTDLVFHSDPDRRLEDRVLDVVRLARAACSLEGVDGEHLRFPCRLDPDAPDALVIADLLRQRGWI